MTRQERVPGKLFKYLTKSRQLRPLREINMDHDLDRSFERLARSEETRARLTGFGTTKQGRAIERQYHEQLAEIIAANREAPDRRERPVWRAVKDIKIDDLERPMDCPQPCLYFRGH
jgi:hypothetical protein